MNRLLTVLVLALCLALAACNEQDARLDLPLFPGAPAAAQVPEIPADIRRDCRQYGVDIPDRSLTVGEMEALWKRDRLRIVKARTCFDRLEAWHQGVRRVFNRRR